MPKTIDFLPFGPQPPGKTPAPLPKDIKCPFAKLRLLATVARLDITSKKDMLWITMPFNGNFHKFLVRKEDFDCIGWHRRQEDFVITITDGTYTCEFVIPGLGNA